MSWIHTHVILPLAEPERHTGLAARLGAIRRFERLPEQAQREEQQQRLRQILEHAYNTVPFYRQRFDEAGFRPSEARTDAPLAIPALTRNDLRDAGDALLSNAFRKQDLYRASSSGTTSTPAMFHRNLEALRNKTALTLQLAASAGFSPGDPVLMLWGAHRDIAHASSWRWRLYDDMLRRKSAPSGILNEEILERFRQRYESHRPKVLYCYASVLAAFAAHLQKTGFRHRPQVLITTAELLSDPDRALIESVFGIPVHNFYGSRDIGMIGSECSEHAGPHFHPWASYVEFDPIGDTPDGPAYRLIVTDLLNYGQPFIRYDTGDCVTLAETRCRCGRWFPRASKILGRVGDGLLLPDGSMIPPVSLGTQLCQIGDIFRAVETLQFVQKTREHVHLRYVVKHGNTSALSELRAICDTIDALAGQRLHWTLEEVHDIPREQSGKLRLCISEIPAAEREMSLA